MTNPGNADGTPPAEGQPGPSETGADDLAREPTGGADPTASEHTPDQPTAADQAADQAGDRPDEQAFDGSWAAAGETAPAYGESPPAGFAPLDYPGAGTEPYQPSGYPAPPPGAQYPPPYPPGPQQPGPQQPGYGYPAPPPYDAPRYPTPPYDPAQPPQFGAGQFGAAGHGAGQFGAGQFGAGQFGAAGYPDPNQPGYPGYYGYPQGYSQGYTQPPSTNTLSIWSLVISLISIPLLCSGLLSFLAPPAAIAGIVLGSLGLNQIKNTGENGRALAIGGIVAGAAVLVMVVVIILMIMLAAAAGA
mgnify:CR=1 FL=1|jgi:hypothetical protein